MSPSTPATCTHERRPGTTVCLRCRHEARLARRARFYRRTVRLAAAALLVAAIAAVGRAGAEALHGRQTPVHFGTASDSKRANLRHESAAGLLSEAPDSRVDSGEAVATRPASHDAATAQPADASLASNAAPVPAPIVDQGRTDLGGGLFAVRNGSSVTVHFDVRHARTRRRDKFDRIVRATLPRVFGAVAESILDTIPPGQLLDSGTLPADLQNEGLHLPLTDGFSLALWPETRPATGGPLVVAYRAEVSR